jgi:TatD DNase family protein
MTIVDMHCHIDLYKNPYDVIAGCNEHDIYVLSVTTTPKAWDITNKISSANSKIKTALGFHPQLANQRYNEIELFDEILPKAKYIGEIGLDGSTEYKKSFDKQISIFQHVLKKIKLNGGRIMSIHSRNAVEIVLGELKNTEGIPILHWFSGNKGALNEAIKQDCWFSIGLPMLLSQRGREIVTLLPKDRVLTETDGPFTTYKDSILLPWNVDFIFPKLSDLWHIPVLEIEQMIFSNFKRLLAI